MDYYLFTDHEGMEDRVSHRLVDP